MKYIQKLNEMISLKKKNDEIQDILIEFKESNSSNYYKFIGVKMNFIPMYALVYPMNDENIDKCILKCQNIFESMGITMIKENEVLNVTFPNKEEIFKQVTYLFKYK